MRDFNLHNQIDSFLIDWHACKEEVENDKTSDDFERAMVKLMIQKGWVRSDKHTINLIIDRVSSVTGVSQQEILGNSMSTEPLKKARSLCVYYIDMLLKTGLSEIGYHLNKHTVTVSGYLKYMNKLKESTLGRLYMAKIERNLKEEGFLNEL